MRGERALTQSELARRVGASRQTVNAIENGHFAPSTELALRLASVLGCRVEDIFQLADREVSLAVESPDALVPGDRVITGRVGQRLIAHRLAGTRAAPDAFVAATGHATEEGVRPFISEQDMGGTALLAGCDPSLSILAEFVARKAPGHRVVPLHSPSEAALRELANGFVHAAGAHLPGNDQNIAQARRALSAGGGRVVNYASWEQGIVVQGGNPKIIRSVQDLARGDVTIVNRDAGSGSRRLLDEALAAAGIPTAGVAGYTHEVETHMAVARAVQAGIADAGIALRAVASIFDLDFIPLEEVRFDLVIPAEHLVHSTIRVMLDVLQDRHLRADLAALPGYEVSRTGATLIELKAA